MEMLIRDFEDECQDKYAAGLIERACESLSLYKDYAAQADGLLMCRHGGKMLTQPYQLESLLNAIENYFDSYQYKYKILIDTTTVEFNPIENYSMREEGRDEIGGKVDGSEDLTKFKTTTETGERDLQNTTGKQDSTQRVSPENDENWRNQSKLSNDERVDKTHANSAKDTVTEDVRVTTHTFKRSGNIGVTTSQQMIASSRNDIAEFSIAAVMCEDVAKYFTSGVWFSL